MTICPRCRFEYNPGAEWCPDCRVAMLRLVEWPAPTEPVDLGEDDEWGDDPEPWSPSAPPDLTELRLLFEEPLPEMADMIREFLQNSGIACVVQANSLGHLYRLMVPVGRARVYVHSDDFDEARELVQQFFGTS
ncbi:MAG TPA: DUF2007 domain-containing protein [Candidatus Eisenbacteria bacterium]